MLYDYEAEGNNGFDPVDFDVLMDDLAHVDAESSDSEDADCTTDEEGSEENDYQSRKKKKRKTCSDVVVFRRKKYRVPRVLVNDIRKCYAKMFMNVMNSADFSMLYGFLDTYYVGNAQHVTTKYVKGKDQKCFTMNFYGVEEVAKYWYCIQNMSPDNVLQISDMTIQHTTGRIISKLHKVGTHIYEEPQGRVSYYAPYVLMEEKYGRENMYVQNTATNDIMIGYKKGASSDDLVKLAARQEKTMDEKLESMRSIVESVESVVKRLPLRRQPESIVADGDFIIHTDENKRITKLEINIVY